MSDTREVIPPRTFVSSRLAQGVYDKVTGGMHTQAIGVSTQACAVGAEEFFFCGSSKSCSSGQRKPQRRGETATVEVYSMDAVTSSRVADGAAVSTNDGRGRTRAAESSSTAQVRPRHRVWFRPCVPPSLKKAKEAQAPGENISAYLQQYTDGCILTAEKEPAVFRGTGEYFSRVAHRIPYDAWPPRPGEPLCRQWRLFQCQRAVDNITAISK
jgi:hypothetical protein